MSLVLQVDGQRWRTHLRDHAEANPGLVPVTKGNGYGFTLGRLARKAQWLRDLGLSPLTADTIAVGTYDELPHVTSRFGGDLLVLTPWRPFGSALDVDAALDNRLIHTVGRVEDVTGLLARRPEARFVLERMTSMRRHGLSARELRAVGRLLREHPRARLEGVAFHLPLDQGSHLCEVSRLMNDVVAAGLTSRSQAPLSVWVSHLSSAELASLRASYSDFTFRPRVGTSLWLGDRDALRVSATVLDVHALERGDAFGYRARTAPRSGHLLIVSGGTAHGIGLESPTGDTRIRARAATLARGGLDAVGFVRSPFSIDNKLRLFAEPPHMQASMLFLPAGARVPEVGEQVGVRVRYTTTAFDRVEVS